MMYLNGVVAMKVSEGLSYENLSNFQKSVILGSSILVGFVAIAGLWMVIKTFWDEFNEN